MSSTDYRSLKENMNGGRVAILFLLFALAIYQFIHAGYNAFAIICILPVFAIVVILSLKNSNFIFWTLVVVNYFIQWKSLPSPGIPLSLPNEMLEILLLVMAIIEVKGHPFGRLFNVMLGTLIVWCSFCTLEVLNDSCGLGIQVGAWYAGARMMAFQLMYAFLVFTLYITNPRMLIKYLYVWGGLTLFAVAWVWKQQHFGMTDLENAWLQGRVRATHILNGGTTIRYFSTFNDAACFGINMGSTAVVYLILGITTKIKRHRYFFLAVGLLSIWGMMPSGTRTAMACIFAGLGVYIFLSKSFKIAVPVSIAFTLMFCFLAFTTIGNSNSQIRRMRSAFNKDDASANTRSINKEVMKKYLAEAPWGIGIGIGYENVPANNKYRKLATLPPDSEYVFIWQHTGKIGLIIFIITTFVMFGGGCWIVLTKLNNPALRGIGSGLCCGFVAMQLGGYANQVLMQFPNCLLFYGGLTLVYVLPYIEPEWEGYEKKLLEEQAERERIKLEKKRAKRV